MNDNEIDIRTLMGVLRRRYQLIVVTVVLLVAAAALVVSTLTPVFTATALVLVDPSRKNLLDPSASTGIGGETPRVDSEVELVTSNNVLEQVVRSADLANDPEFGVSIGWRARILSWLRLAEPTLPTGEAAAAQALADLEQAASAQRRGLTYLIEVQVRSESPAKAARLANAVADAYIRDQVQSKVNSTLVSRDALQARIIQARDAIAASENSFDAFIDQNVDQIVQDTGNSDIARLRTQLAELQESRTRDTSLLSLVETNLDAGDYSGLAASLESSNVSELEAQRSELSQAIAASADAEQASLRQQLADIENRLQASANVEVTDLQDRVRTYQDQEVGMRTELRQAVLASSLSADVLTQIYDLQQSAEIARQQYQVLLSRSQDLDAQAALQLADSRIVSPATAPSRASFPNTRLIMVLAAALALVLGVGLAFLYENFVGGFVSEDQLNSVLKSSNSISVPRDRLSKESTASLSDNLINSPLSGFAESIRRLRATLDHNWSKASDKSNRAMVIMVSSTEPNEGKSTLAISLARSYALAGRSVLLIDGDLRKPSIHTHLNLEPSTGLLDFLLSVEPLTNLEALMARDPLTNLVVMVGARRSNTPTDQLISGESFKKVIEAASQTMDVVVIDTPPVAAVVDPLYMADYADAIVFVVRWSSTAQTTARKALNALRSWKSADTEIVTVLNQQEQTRATYYGKYRSYYTS